LAPFILLAAVAFACGSPAQAPGSAPAATAAADVEEISLEISSLM
jgi:hypothetical protein